MATSHNTPDTGRNSGGPGSNPKQRPPQGTRRQEPDGQPRHSAQKSQVSGGGGERDSRHTHDPELKGEK